MIRLLKLLIKISLILEIVFLAIWNFGAFNLIPGVDDLLRILLTAVLGLACIFLLFARLRVTGAFILIAATAVNLLFFFSQTASNDRVWEASVARLPLVQRVSADLIKIKNIRNFHYKTETEFSADYYDKTFDLSKLSSLDFIVSYWAGMDIAHVMVSFGFEEKDFITFSIETRKEANEAYSPVAGFYRNYELIYIPADERDLIGLRTKIRNPNEQVYLFRASPKRENLRKLFESYLDKMQAIESQPQFYNTLTTNCTTQILWQAQAFNKNLKYNWEIFLSGHLPQYLYGAAAIDTSMPFNQLFELSKINYKANVDIESDGFSNRIRAGLPVGQLK